MNAFGFRIMVMGSLSAVIWGVTGCGATRSANPFALNRENTQLKTAMRQYQDQLAQARKRADNLDADNEQLHNLLAQEQEASRRLRDGQKDTAVAARRPAGGSSRPEASDDFGSSGRSESGSEDWDDAKEYGPARGRTARSVSPPDREGGGRQAGSNGGIQMANVPGADVVRDGDKVRIRITNTNLFDPGKATLKPGAAQVLDRVAAAIRRDYAGNPIGIEGHTDADPIRKSNWRDNHELSVQRALAVYDYLSKSAGIPSDQLYVAGFGSNMPLASNKSPTGKAQNRRVELVIEPNGARASTDRALR